MVGLIITSFGLNFILEIEGKTYTATTKSKKTDFVVGDYVEATIINQSQAQIVKLIPRTTLVMRSDKNRSKMIASNITQLIIVIAVKPNFNINFLNRCLVFSESQNITPIIVVNKMDLPKSKAFADNITALYNQQLKYLVIPLCAIDNCNTLLTELLNQKSLLIGQSGMGKSTITNKIIPTANTPTNNITKFETSGKHTTTHASLYHINESTSLIDCPGLHEFGLHHLPTTQITSLFPECRELIGKCRFRNCIHINEPDCAIINAYNLGIISKQRLEFLQSLLKTK